MKATEATERADERRRSECDECDDARRAAGGGRVARSVLAGKEKRREGRASEAARRIHKDIDQRFALELLSSTTAVQKI